MNDKEAELTLGDLIIEGKTKQVFAIKGDDGKVLLKSKDRITAGNLAKSNDLAGKAAISTSTTCKVFEILKESGIKTHHIRKHGDDSFVAKRCEMIPIEWVTRRIATGSFLKRNPGVNEGYKFSPPKLETFYKDDANNDPQWSHEQLVEAKMAVGSVTIGQDEIHMMGKVTVAIFEVLERYWSSLDCALIDMKIEFGIDGNGDIILADVIDSDSWRLWPSGDKRLMKDKQVYRDMKDVTDEKLQQVKRNFEWVSQQLDRLDVAPKGRVIVIMGSEADMNHCTNIVAALDSYGVPWQMRISSAHKQTDETLEIVSKYEGDGVPTVFVCVAGRSNGLGPVVSGNCSYPVINCPPIRPEWAAQDIWSSLRMPSGLGCSTVISAEGAALAAAQILALGNHAIWSKLRVKKLNTWLNMKKTDINIRS